MADFVLKEVEIENFKSYQGKHTLGPFMHFTAIVGPNGCGKSNLVEALSFVLGEKLGNLRVKEQKELIFGSHLENNTNSCECANVLSRFSKDNETITFQRSDEFFINSEKFSPKKYREFVRNCGVCVKLNNFLVLQGDVERILNENPKHLTDAFEKCSKSVKHKKRYDSAQTLLKNEMNEFTHAIRKKRDALNQKRNLDTCKTEAGTYATLTNKILTHERDMHLLKLLILEDEISESVNSVSGIEEGLRKIKEQSANLNEEYAMRKYTAARMYRKITSYERQLADAELEYQKLKPQLDDVTNKIIFLTTKTLNEKKSIDSFQIQEKASRNRILELEKSLSDSRILMEILEQPKFNQAQQFTESQNAEYNNYKIEYNKSTSKNQNELKKLQETRDGIIQEMDSLSTSILQMEKRLSTLSENELEISQKLEKTAASFSKLNEIRNEKSVMYESSKNDVETAKSSCEDIQLRLNDVNKSLEEYKVDMVEFERQKRISDITDKLKFFFPGVHGRLADLIEPVHKRYAVAITKVLGRNIDAVIVDDERVAFDCIEYLRQQKLGRIIFFPLKSMKAKQLNEKYRHLGGTSKLLIDTVKQDQIYRSLVVSIFGNTIICDDLDESLQLSIGAVERRKVVCIDGTLFLKNGIISGGSKSLQTKAKRWNDKKITDTKLEKDKLQLALQTQHEIIGKVKQFENMRYEIDVLNLNASACENETKELEKALKKIQNQSSNLKTKIEQQNSFKLQCDLKFKKTNKKIETLEASLKVIKNSIYSEFCRSYSIENIENFEETNIKEIKEILNRRATCQKHIDVLNNQLEYERSNLFLNRKNSIQTLLDSNLQELKSLTQSQEKFDESLHFYNTKMDELKSELISQKQSYEKEVSNKFY